MTQQSSGRVGGWLTVCCQVQQALWLDKGDQPINILVCSLNDRSHFPLTSRLVGCHVQDPIHVDVQVIRGRQLPVVDRFINARPPLAQPAKELGHSCAHHNLPSSPLITRSPPPNPKASPMLPPTEREHVQDWKIGVECVLGGSSRSVQVVLEYK